MVSWYLLYRVTGALGISNLHICGPSSVIKIIKMKYNRTDVIWWLVSTSLKLNLGIHSPLGTDHLTWRGGLWFFVSFRIFFSDNTRVRIFIFFVAQTQFFFSRNYHTLGYMTKTLNQIIFFFLQQNQNISFSNIGNQNIFLEKNHNPLLEVKWSVP